MKNCTRCADCCTNPNMPIALYPNEIVRIKRNAKPKGEWIGLMLYGKNNIFSKSYCFKIRHEGKTRKVYFGIIYNAQGRCPFLKGRNQCRIYMHRPTGCRSFYCKDRLTMQDINKDQKRYREQAQYILKVREWNRHFTNGAIRDFEEFIGFKSGIRAVRTKNFVKGR